MSTLPKGYLFGVKDKKVVIKDKLFVQCNQYHPDTARLVVLSESPCKDNGFKSVSIMARYIVGQYHSVSTGDVLPIIGNHTVWTESSIAEGPYKVVEIGTSHFYTVDNFIELMAAYTRVVNLNMLSFGNPAYTVVNEFYIPVDNNGHLCF